MRFRYWLLRKIFRGMFRMGYGPISEAAVIYKLVREEWERSFYEENGPTVDANLREAFEATQCQYRAHTLDEEVMIVNLKERL